MLRQRAWDIMRDEFPHVDESASMAEAVRAVQMAGDNGPGRGVCLVLDSESRPVGALTMAGVLKAVERYLFSEENLSGRREPDWDAVLAKSCALLAQTPVTKYLDKNLPVFKPGDPVPLLLESFVDSNRPYGAVVEGGKVIGLLMLADLYKELAKLICQGLES